MSRDCGGTPAPGRAPIERDIDPESPRLRARCGIGLKTDTTAKRLALDHASRPPSTTVPPESSRAGGVGERRGCLAADDRRGLVDELVVVERRDHEQREVDAT